MSDYALFTSESVSEGHPDKVADQISDALLDEALRQDSQCRAALEALVKNNHVVLAGELSGDVQLETEALVRDTINGIGYDDEALGFTGDNCDIRSLIDRQSPDIAQGVDRDDPDQQGAGDQGMMFGYATDETPSLMPAPIHWAHALARRQAELRHSKALPWLRPDAKTQVSVRYRDGAAAGIDAVVLSTQHDPDVEPSALREAVMEEIIKPTLPAEFLHAETRYHINPTGQFIIGGPVGDCGLTGRKIIVDTYGGMARHGGGAFSGKDPSKVDRSAAYAARYVAKNIVAAGLASRCEVQLSYAIGEAEPVSISIDSRGDADDRHLSELVREHFDLRPAGIIRMLDLQKPIYLPTSSYGHFGRDGDSFHWERIDRAEALKAAF